MKSVLDIYLRGVVYNIRTTEYNSRLPMFAAHFHNIPGIGSKLYVCDKVVYTQRYDGISKVLLYV